MSLEQEKNNVPLCMLRCVTSVPLLQKVLEPVEHNIPACILRCVTRARLLWKALEQEEHNKLLFSEMCNQCLTVTEGLGACRAQRNCVYFEMCD